MILLFIVLLQVVLALEDLEKSKHMENLDADTLDNIISSRSSTVYIIEAYAPWCHHCQDFAPFVTECSDKIAKDFKPKQVQMTRINCAIYKDECEKLKIIGFPTVLAYYHGTNKEEFNGDRRTADPFYKWIHGVYAKIHEKKEIKPDADDSLFSKVYMETQKQDKLFDLEIKEITSINDLKNDPWIVYNGPKYSILDKLAKRFNGLLRIGFGELTEFPKRVNPYFLYYLKSDKSTKIIPHDSHIDSIDEIYSFAFKSLLLTFIYPINTFELAGFDVAEVRHHFTSIFFPLTTTVIEHQYMLIYIDLKTITPTELKSILFALSNELDLYDYYPIGISVQRPTEGSRIKFYLTHDPLIAQMYVDAEVSKKLTTATSSTLTSSFSICTVKNPSIIAENGNEVFVKCQLETTEDKITSFVTQYKQFDIIEITPLNVKDIFTIQEPQVVVLLDPYLHTNTLSKMHLVLAMSKTKLKHIYFIDAWYFKSYVKTIFNLDELVLPQVIVIKNKSYFKPETELNLNTDELDKVFDFITSVIDKSEYNTFTAMHIGATNKEERIKPVEAENQHIPLQKIDTTESDREQGNDEFFVSPFFFIIVIVFLCVVAFLNFNTKKTYTSLPTHKNNKFA